MPVRRLLAHPAVDANRGRTALQRGPIVFCVEGLDIADPDGSPFALIVGPDTEVRALDSDLLGGSVILEGSGPLARRTLQDDSPQLGDPVTFGAIPYALRAHREPSPMTVWLATEAAVAEATPAPTLARRSRADASFHQDLVLALSDQADVSGSADKSRPHFHFWPRKGSVEWVAYEFPDLTVVDGVEVYWMADVPHGECDLPASWRVLWKDGDQWRPVAPREETYPLDKDRWNRVDFAPVTTAALRLEISLREGLSAGIHEWRVHPQQR
jgi:hypothetical protein